MPALAEEVPEIPTAPVELQAPPEVPAPTPTDGSALARLADVLSGDRNPWLLHDGYPTDEGIVRISAPTTSVSSGGIVIHTGSNTLTYSTESYIASGTTNVAFYCGLGQTCSSCAQVLNLGNTNVVFSWNSMSFHPDCLQNVFVPEATPEQVRQVRRTQAQDRLAKYKAERLLMDYLNDEQRRDLKKWGFFKLYVLKAGKMKVYRIRRGQVQNVDLVEETPGGLLKPIKTLCLHPVEKVPDADAMLVQKLMLETDEDEFLKIANQMDPTHTALVAPQTLRPVA